MNHIMEELTIPNLLEAAKAFCQLERNRQRADLFSITDGKAIGTFVEHLFQEFLSKRYKMTVGNAAAGLDLPSINTDIKVTSHKHPQSSCPYEDSKQKIYGLGYNLIVFVYDKQDDHTRQVSTLDFMNCTFIEASRTGDYQTTTGLRQIIGNNGNVDDIFAFLSDHHIPADEVTLMQMTERILANPPAIGYLTISNAMQWRLRYGRIVALKEQVEGIIPVFTHE